MRSSGLRLGSFLRVVILLSLAGCSAEQKTPEDQVRDFIAEGEAAVEARDLGAVTALISKNYKDDAGRARRDLVRLMAGYLLRNKSIHLLPIVKDLQIMGDEQDKADVLLIVAMAGSPISGVEQLGALRADLHRFELSVGKVEKDEWRLRSARWQQASLEEFIH